MHDSRWCSWFALAACRHSTRRSSTLKTVSSETVLQKAKLEIPEHFISLAKSPDGHSPQIATYTVHWHVLQEGAEAKYAYRQRTSFPMAPCNPSKHQLLERSLCKRKLEPQENTSHAWLCLGAGVAARCGWRHALQEHQLLQSASATFTALQNPPQLEPVHTLDRRNKARFLFYGVLFVGSGKPAEVGLGKSAVVLNTHPLLGQRIPGTGSWYRDRALPSVLGKVAALPLCFVQLHILNHSNYSFHV